MKIVVNKRVDAKGLACPMPIVKTKRAVETIEPGQVVEVQATDKGSLADLKGWANSVGHHYIGTELDDGVFRHFIRKADPEEEKKETTYPRVIDNNALREQLESAESFTVIDTREQAEYAFGHIPGAISIPLGVLKEKASSIPSDQPIYVICRSGNRSDRACQMLTELGFENVTNVLPGMSEWTGPIKKMNEEG